jgi:hypothetical protein
MKIVWLLLFVLALSGEVIAQSRIDSLRKRLAFVTTPAERMQAAAELGKALFFGSQYDSLPKYGTQLRELARDQDNTSMELLADVFLAQGLARKDSAHYFQQAGAALARAVSAGEPVAIGMMCLGLGSQLLTLGDYRGATAKLLQGYEAIPDAKTPEMLGLKSDLIRTVSAVYHHLGRYTEALDYGLQSSRLADLSRVPMQRLKSYLNLSGLYGELSSPENNLGTRQDRVRYYREAKKYMRLSYETSARVGSKMTRGATAFNLGSLFQEGGQVDSATFYLNEAISLGRQLSFHELLSNAYRAKAKLTNMPSDSALFFLDAAYREAELALNPMSAVSTSLDKARFLFEHNQIASATAIARIALAESTKLGLLNDQRSANFLLYEIMRAQGNAREALNFHEQYVLVKDSMVNEKNYAKIEELKTRYETELKDGEIKNLEQRAALQALELRQKNLLLVGVLLAAALVAALLFLFFRQRALQQQQKVLAVENRLLRLQLDPHFLSNALVSIQRFVLENNAGLASSYLTKFSRLMRQLLEYSRRELITIEEEIDLLRNYLDLQKLRLKDSFDYAIHVDDSLAIRECKIPPMFAQPFVENAVEHGVTSVEHGKIELFFRAQGDRLILEITDNGKGINPNKTGDHIPLSTTIIRDRIALLNRNLAVPIELLIGNVTTSTGTRVQLSLPISS